MEVIPACARAGAVLQPCNARWRRGRLELSMNPPRRASPQILRRKPDWKMQIRRFDGHIEASCAGKVFASLGSGRHEEDRLVYKFVWKARCFH